MGRLDQALATYVGEIDVRENIHHAPGMIGGIAFEFETDRGTNGTARAIASDNIMCMNGFGSSAGPIESNNQTAIRRRFHRNKTASIIGEDVCRRFAHAVKIEIMHTRLVENDMRKFRQPVFDILHPSIADNVFRRRVVRLPERHLVDPAGFPQNALAEAEGVKHLHRAAGDSIGLAPPKRAILLLDDAGFDVRIGRELRCKR